jgi:hypothetical protein
VGQHVDGWCPACLRVAGHAIVTITNGVITEVRCDTCGSQHTRSPAPRRRSTPPPPARPSAPRRGRPPGDATPRQRSYAALLRGRTPASARRYSSSTRFEIGDVVSHSAFGIGIVTAERDYAKIDILFPDGLKVLLQGR